MSQTTSFEVRPFEPEDYETLINGLPVEPGLARVVGDPLKRGKQIHGDGPAWSGVVDGRLVASAGLMIPWPGFGAAWAVLDRGLARAHRVPLHRALLRVFGRAMHEYKLVRVETSVSAAFAPGLRLARHLGFREECEMPKYGPYGDTYLRLVLFPEEYR